MHASFFIAETPYLRQMMELFSLVRSVAFSSSHIESLNTITDGTCDKRGAFFQQLIFEIIALPHTIQ